MTVISNIDLLKNCATRIEDQKSWFEFIQRYNNHIKLSVLRAYKLLSIVNLGKELVLEEEIRDLVQEVYIRLIKNDCKLLKNFNPANNTAINNYLTLTCSSVVKDYFRKFGRAKRKGPMEFINGGSYLNHDEELIKEKISSFLSPSPEEEAITKDIFKKIEDFYSSVNSRRNNKKRKLIFQLYFLQGLSIRDISRIKGLNVSLANANTIVWRMKKEIRNFICNDSLTSKAK